MDMALKKIRVIPGGELDRATQEAARGPVLLERAGELYRLTKEPESKEDIFANFDPEKARAAFESLQGVLAGVDIEQLKADLKAERGQDSIGRPGDK